MKVDVVLCDDWLFEESFACCAEHDYRTAGWDVLKDECAWIPLMDDDFLAVVPMSLGYEPGQVITRDELFSHPYVFDAEYVYASYLTSNVTSLVKVSADHNATVLSMVASGTGVSVLPKLSLSTVPSGVSVVRINPPGKRTLGVALPPNATSVARDFARYLEHQANRLSELPECRL